jgi:formate-dependent nitrite reductase membrane component NrfD
VIALSFGLLCAAMLIGSGLAIRFLRGPLGNPPPPALALCHGALGASSLAVLLAALRLGPPPRGMGTESFGRIAAALLAFALFLGLAFLWGSLRGKRPAETVVGAHALLAFAAFVVLLALIVLR